MHALPDTDNLARNGAAALKRLRARLAIVSAGALVLWCAAICAGGDAAPRRLDVDGRSLLRAPHNQKTAELRRRYPHLIGKLRGPLVELFDERAQRGAAAAKAFAQARGVAVSDDSIVVLVIPSGDAGLKVLAKALADQGARIIRVGERHIKARVPLAQLAATATKIESIEHIRIPARPKADNTVVTEARGNDSWTNALNWHDHGFRGQGVKVAVIDLGFIGLAARKAADEIPASAIERDESGTGMEQDTGHGCGVAEIVYDMAPDAQLYLTKIADESDLEAAKNYCITNGIYIVNHSVGWYGFNFFDGVAYGSVTPSPVTIANDANGSGILWVNSAGNDQQGHALVGWQDADSDGVLDWAAGVEMNEIGYVGSGSVVTLWLTWNAWPTTNQDFGLTLWRWGKVGSTWKWVEVRTSGDPQSGSQAPVDGIQYSVSKTNMAGDYAVTVERINADSSPSFVLRSWYQDLEYKAYEQTTAVGGSIGCPADAASVLAVGAIDEDDYREGPVEDYSSLGPNNASYTGGTSITKPDICCADDTASVTYSGGFTGTSASSPHTAALAALVKSRFPTYTNSQIRSSLESSCIDLGETDKDNTFGYGPVVLKKVWGLTMAVSPSGGGTTTPAVPGPYAYDDGTNAPISATPNANYAFKNWTGEGIADPNSATTTISMTADRTATAVFEQVLPIDVSGVSPANAGDVPKYSKVELLVTLSYVAATKFYAPYDPATDPNGLDLSATFVSPSSAEWHVHGFYDGSAWRIRFAPNETGSWTFSVTATDSSGTDTWTGGSFTCTSSAYPGWARIDGHCLRFTEGQVLFGVGHNNGWQYDVEQPSLSGMAGKGENLLSFWIAAPWDTPASGPDRAPIENVTQGIGNYNQTACAYLDGVVGRAEDAGVYLLPTVWSHGQLRTATGHPWGAGWWDNNAYGTVCSATDFFQTGSTAQWRYQKHFYRYLIARWGYSRALAGWVGLCEIEGTTGYVSNPSQAEAWCAAVREYFVSNDPFRGNASSQYPIAFTKSDWQSDWNTWGPTFDLRAVDSYRSQTDDVGIADRIGTQMQSMWGTGKPGFHAEFGGNTTSGATQPTHLHNGIWAGTCAGAAMTPLVWCDGGSWPMLTDPVVGGAMRDHLEYLAAFTAGITPSLIGNPNLGPASLGVSGDCLGWGMTVADAGFAWIQNPAGTMGGQTVTVSGLAPANYSVVWYDVWTSGSTVFTSSTVAVAEDGILTCTVPTLSRADIAVKFGAQPTVAVVSAFRASVQEDGVAITWETASETGTLGFCVVRRDEATGARERVGKGVLRSLMHSPLGGRYRLVDPGAERGKSYSYTLVEVEAGGRERRYGPCRVTLGKGAPAWLVGTPAPRRPGAERFGYSRVAHEAGDAEPQWARQSVRAPRSARPLRRASGGKGAVKIGVKDDGLYFVGGSELAPLLGVSEESIGRRVRRGLLAMSCQGRAVAYLPAEDGSGITFYGKRLESIYTDENIYWVELGRGTVMRQPSGSDSIPGTGAETFVDTVHAEQNYWPAVGLFHDPEADFWLWAYLVAGSPGVDRKSFIVRADGAAPAGAATLKVRVKGGTDAEGSPDHHARIAVNGTVIGEGRWDGNEGCTLEIAFGQGLLLDGANSVSVEAVLPAETPYSIFYVDSFDLTYQRYYTAVGDSLLCRAGPHPVVTVSGFAEPAISVFDVTDPWNPAAVRGGTIDEVDGTYRVSFAADGPDSVYLALTPNAVKSPSSVRPDEPSRLKWRGNRAGYLVIAPSTLEEAAQCLAERRRGQGLSALVVDLEDIYDEFACGIATPKAIQSFLAWARKKWRKPPRYVVLAGHGTWDYKDYLGYDDNLIPALLVDTAYGLFSRDSELSREVAVGRLPARTPGELRAMVTKIIAYERSRGEWRKRVLMVADNSDGGGNFPRESDDLARLLPKRYAVDRVYLSQSPLEEARRRLISGLDAGTVMTCYMGHGGMGQWAHEGLLTSGDVGALSNGSRLPVVVALTCLCARFAFPGYDCIGEAFVVKPGGGAVALWGPSGMSQNDEAKGLGGGFIQAALGRPGNRLGDAILSATAKGSETSKTYNLLGDPALKLRAWK